jgi:hypothetical protein
LESLAILAVFLISLTVLGGPISLVLTFLPKRLLSLVVTKILTCAIALLAIVVGIILILNVGSIGAMIMGALGAACAGVAIYRVIKVIPKL